MHAFLFLLQSAQCHIWSSMACDYMLGLAAPPLPLHPGPFHVMQLWQSICAPAAPPTRALIAASHSRLLSAHLS